LILPQQNMHPGLAKDDAQDSSDAVQTIERYAWWATQSNKQYMISQTLSKLITARPIWLTTGRQETEHAARSQNFFLR
jgi:hypothetical protein